MNRNRVNDAADILIKCSDDFQKMKHAVEELYEIFNSITGIGINNLNEGDIHLPSGKAISPSGAAHCLLELKRTAIFLRGIKQAIDSKLDDNQETVRILYAGCGPYGTLITPLLHFYPSDRLKVTFLDINLASLNAAEKLLQELNLNKYIEQFVLEDATTYKVDQGYDVVISETMQSALKKEPQVAVMQNLIPQLSSKAVFIPEEISIDAFLTNPKMEMDRLMYHENEQPPFERHELGNVFKLGKNTLDSIQSKIKIAIPQEKIGQFPILKLFTTVKVFNHEVLSVNDSSITLPIQFYDFRKQTAGDVEFWYLQGEKPRIESTFISNKTTLNN